jgi:hypothetical protein
MISISSEQAVRLQMAMPHAAVLIVPKAEHTVHYFTADGIVKMVKVEGGNEALKPGPQGRAY